MTFTLIRIALAALALGLALPVDAQRFPTTNPGPHAAQISGTPGKALEDLAAVRIIAIDGRNLTQPRSVLWLEPGRYELRVQAVPQRGQRRSRPGEFQRSRRTDAEARREALSITLEVEAGKTYQIRARYNRADTEGVPYSTVLWRIEE